MESKSAFSLLKQLVTKHGQQKHMEAIESLHKQMEEGFTVVGIYGDNQQPWVTFIDSAENTVEASRKAIQAIYAKGTNGIEQEDIFVVEVFKGYHQGILDPHSHNLPDHVIGLKERYVRNASREHGRT